MPEVHTAVAFIKGEVEVTKNMPSSSQDRVTVSAMQSGGANPTNASLSALAASQQAQQYSLTVIPGTWFVWAQLGPVQSAKQQVIIAAGEAGEVDFVFGKDPD